MPIVNASSAASSNTKGAMVPIAHITSTGASAAFDFQNIPQGFQDLMFVMNMRNEYPSSGIVALYLWCNSDIDAGTNRYSY